MFDRGHFWTSALIVIGVSAYIETAYLELYHGSLNNSTVTPLEDPLKMLPFLNKSRVSMFYVHGFSETANDTNTKKILSAYLTANYTDVILLDWSREARVGILGLNLSYALVAVPNCEIVGEEFGVALVRLIHNGIDEDKIHIVGHSLGAHLAGYAGAKVQDLQHNISRITGVDPAGPLFEGETSMNGLKASDAKFVDVLHTDPTLFGTNQSVGDVDFWANCGSSTQPACKTVNSSDSSSLDAFCSHQISCNIFAEAVLNATAFPAAYAANCTEWHLQSRSPEVIYLGDKVDRSARGNFYFSTNDKYPLSIGEEGLKPNDN